MRRALGALALAGLAALSALACGTDPLPARDADADAVDPVADIAPPRDTDAPALALTLHALDAPPGPPFPVLVTAPDPVSATVTLMVAGTAHSVHLYRGRGSVTLTLPAAGTAEVSLDGAPAAPLVATARPERRLAGPLAAADLDWGPEADVVVTATVTVPAGATLTVAAGTRVRVAERADVEVLGALAASGTDLAPVLFTVAPGAASWGALRVLPGAEATLAHTRFVAGGGDASRAFGHSGSSPVVWVDGARLTMAGGGVFDSPGKAFGTRDAEVALSDVAVARCDTGGEFEATALTADRLHVTEIPDADGRLDDDDNDGVYLRSARVVAGAPVESVLRDAVFAVGEDDAIDHNEALVRVERAWIEGFAHEGVAASVGRRITVVDSVVRGCDQGIEAGYGAPEVVVLRTTVTGCGTGLRLGDSYDWEDAGSLAASGVIVVGNGQAVRNYARGRGGPLPGAITVRCSVVDDPAWVGVDGNVAGPPEGAWAEGCATGPALGDVQCSMDVAGPECDSLL